MTPPEFEPPGGTFGQAWVGAGTSQVADLGAGSRAVLSLPASPFSPSPSDFCAFFCSVLQLVRTKAHSISLSFHFFFFLSYFSLALSLSSTISFLFNRSLRWPHVEIAGPREAKPGFVGIRGNLTGSLRPPRRRGGVAIGRASA